MATQTLSSARLAALAFAEASEPDSWGALPHTLPDPVPALPAKKQTTDKPSPRRSQRRTLLPPAPLVRLTNPVERPSASDRIPHLKHGTFAERRRRRPEIRRAKVLSDRDVIDIASHIAGSRPPRESRLLQFYLSVKAGLRVGEIADLRVRALLDGGGRISPFIDVYSSKTHSRRFVPMHPLIHDTLDALLDRYPEATHVAFSIGNDGSLRPMSHTAATNWFHRLYAELGYEGCSSHSGRRTFATKLMRTANIRVVQQLLGHAKLSSTQCYLEPGDDVARLVHAL